MSLLNVFWLMCFQKRAAGGQNGVEGDKQSDGRNTSQTLKLEGLMLMPSKS